MVNGDGWHPSHRAPYQAEACIEICAVSCQDVRVPPQKQRRLAGSGCEYAAADRHDTEWHWRLESGKRNLLDGQELHTPHPSLRPSFPLLGCTAATASCGVPCGSEEKKKLCLLAQNRPDPSQGQLRLGLAEQLTATWTTLRI
jgi:hypothetical protein